MDDANLWDYDYQIIWAKNWMNNMKVKELIKKLQKEDPEEDIYIWAGNWPVEHHTTNLKIKRPYGSTEDEKRNIVYNPLIIGQKY